MSCWTITKQFNKLQLYYFCTLVPVVIGLGGTFTLYFHFPKGTDEMVQMIKGEHNGWEITIGIAMALTLVAILIELLVHIKFCLLITCRANPNQVGMKTHTSWYIGTLGTTWRIILGGLLLVALGRLEILHGVHNFELLCFILGFVSMFVVSIRWWMNYVNAAYSMCSKNQEGGNTPSKQVSRVVLLV